MIKNLTCLLLLLLSINSYADQHIKLSAKQFNPVSWKSNNNLDYVSVEGPANVEFFYAVQIHVDHSIGYPVAGINIHHCGAITHVNAGSTVICFLNKSNPALQFSSDSETIGTTGVLQIE